MNALGGPCLLLVLVLVATLATLPTLGWIGLPGSTGTGGVYDGARADSRFELPAMDGLIPLFSSVGTPVPISLAPVAFLGARDTPSGATRSLAPRGPPSG
jgi:hypothetical protein